MIKSSPSIAELPSPPAGRTGWPWTIEPPQLPKVRPDGVSWPRILIVTPSYNQGQFIEETIRSVLLQGYPSMQYIIIDGGSTDETLNILAKYAEWLTYWVSEPDTGQANAINKGFRRGNGKIYGWLNSDDVYRPEALRRVGRAWTKEMNWLVGCEQLIGYRNGAINKPEKLGTVEDWLRRMSNGYSYCLPQPAAFWSSEVWLDLGGLLENLHYVFDHEFFFRIFSEHGPPLILDEVLVNFRIHAESKTSSRKFEFLHDRVTIAEMHARQLSKSKSRSLLARVRKNRARFDLFRILDMPRNERKWPLLKLPLQRPQIYLDRMYWGAVRRVTDGDSSV